MTTLKSNDDPQSIFKDFFTHTSWPVNFAWRIVSDVFIVNILVVIFRTVVFIFIELSKNNFSAAVSSGVPQISLVYLSIEIIQSGKSF